MDGSFILQKFKISRVILGVLHANMFSSSTNKSQSGTCIVAPPTLKSNLKSKTTTVVEENQELRSKRKVTWPDAHGKDLAQVQVYESSVLEEEESEGVKNSCICVIQ